MGSFRTLFNIGLCEVALHKYADNSIHLHQGTQLLTTRYTVTGDKVNESLVFAHEQSDQNILDTLGRQLLPLIVFNF